MAKCRRTKDSEQLLWVVDHAVAYVENGAVTVQIDKPTRCLPRLEAFKVADDIWFASQIRELEIARQRGETKEIPLTDRQRRSSLRLGGGFMITQGTNLVVARRHLDAPRPGQFCECGGVFEVFDPEGDEDFDIINDYIASLLKESQEIILIRDNILYVPQLAPSPSVQIGFKPPGKLSAYNKILEKEVIGEVKKASIPVDTDNIRRFWMKLIDYEYAVKLEFAYSPQLSVEIAPEIDSSSLECVGVLSFPQDIDAAVIAYLNEQLPRTNDDENEENSEISKIRKEINRIKEEYDNKWKDKKYHGFQYWDTELGWDPVLKEEDGPVDREIHLINTENGDDVKWYICSDEKGNRERKYQETNLWDELASTRLGKTSGRFATEKLEKAINMHCPYPRLQPLVRL